MDQLLGYRHSAVMLLDEEGSRLYTVASHGFPTEGVGSEVSVGDGVPGAAAERCEPVREGNLRQMHKYSNTVRRAFEADGDATLAFDVPVPALPDAASRLAVPAMVRGELVGVLVVDSPLAVAFDDDESVLTLVASLMAQTVDFDRQFSADDAPGAEPVPATTPAGAGEPGATDASLGGECHVATSPRTAACSSTAST